MKKASYSLTFGEVDNFPQPFEVVELEILRSEILTTCCNLVLTSNLQIALIFVYFKIKPCLLISGPRFTQISKLYTKINFFGHGVISRWGG